MRYPQIRIAMLGGSALCLAMPSVALAQAAPAQTLPAETLPAQPAAKPAPQASGLQDIVVTAQRRSERAQDVPIAITTLSPMTIEKQGIKSGFELGKAVPGLVFGNSSAYATPFIRGVGSTNASPGDEPSVATYIDGVYVGNPIVLSLPYGTIQGVEVLKGPQGTLFGRNATGGVINVTLRGPEREFSGTTSLSYDNFRAVEGSLFVTGPLSEKVSGSIDVQLRNQERGYFRNDFDGSRADRENYATVRGKLRIEPTDDLTIDLSADYQRALTGQGGVSGDLPGTVPLAALAGVNYPTQAQHVYSNVSGNNKVETYGGSITATLDLGGPSLKSISSYRHVDYHFHIQNGFVPDGTIAVEQPNPGLVDPQGVPVGTRTVAPGSTYYDNHTTNPYFVTQELQLASDKGRKLEWILGGFAQWSSDKWNSLQVNYLRDPTVPFVEFRNTPQLTRAYAAFGQATYHVTSKLSLVGGLRYSIETKKTHGTQYVMGSEVATNAQSKTFKGLSYHAGINYQPTRGTLFYASASRGFKSGIFVVSNFGGDPVKPERLDDYEIGAKIDITRGLRVNADAYYYDYKNLQVTAVALGGLTALTNAANARMKGVELEVQAAPVHGLTLSLSGAYEDAHYRSFPNAEVFLPSNSAGFYQVTFDASGKRVIRTPKLSGTANASYTFDMASGSAVTLGANYYRTGSFSWEYSGTLTEPSYGILDLSAEWRSPDKRFSVLVYGNNVTNTKYAAGVLPVVQGALAFWGKPAVVGARFRMNFN